MARPEGNPHDALVKFVFKDPAHAAPLLRSLLPERLARVIDWSTLQRRDVTLVEPALRETRTDLVFDVEARGAPLCIYLLFEHQSERDPWMALRLLGYMARLWEDQRKEQGAPLRPIVPVVLFHGEGGWTPGTRFSDLFALPDESLELIRGYCPDFRFLVDDLGTQDDAKLRARALTELAQVALVLLRDGRKTNDISQLLRAWRETFQAVANSPDGVGAMLAVIRYLSRVVQSTRLELETFAREVGPTAETANMTAAEEIEKKAEERGRREERRELLVKQLTLKFGAPDRATLELLTRATPEQLSECAERVLFATTLEDVLAPCKRG